MRVEGRKLDAEEIIFGGVNGNRHRVGDRADFSNATSVNAPITPVNLDNW
jgi:hypothetical protein